jgi:glycosyltransferase involved in cell wall biosynthesis
LKTIYIFAPFDPIPGEHGYPGRFGVIQSVLKTLGHECVWWTSDWDHTGKRRRDADQLPSDIRLLPTPKYQKNVSFRRLYNHRVLADRYLQTVREEIRQGTLDAPSLQFVALPPINAMSACLKIRAEFAGSIVLDIMDVWPETFYQAIPFGSDAMKRWLGRVLFYPQMRQVRRAIAGCDALTAQSVSFLNWARNLGFSGRPSHVCYLGADLSAVIPLRRLKAGGVLRLGYLGAMGMSYDLETLLVVVHRMRQEGHSLELDLVGGGTKEAQLRDWVKTHDLESSIRFHGYLPKQEAFKRLADCHLGLVPMFPESGVTVPYKACEYAGVGMGLIHSLSGELGDLVGKFSAGVGYRAGDERSLYQVLRSVLEDPENVAIYSQGVARMAAAVFDRKKIYMALGNFLSDCSGQNEIS